MSSTHETIEYDRSSDQNVRDLINTAAQTGTIVEVDYDEDTAKVNINGVGVKDDIPIFYHCENSEEVEGGSVVFEEGDRVYVLEKPGTVLPEYIITGFVDGLKSCRWEFKLYRDDDTTVRDKSGNITTPSGLSIDLYALDYIYLIAGGIIYGALPGHHGLSSAYWTYNEDSRIWTYDNSVDYPNDWCKGTYNTNTGYFIINKTMEEPTDRLYWASFFCKDPRTITDPAENAAVSTENIDKHVGVVITLTEAGKAQILQPPTDTVAGRPFIVKASESNTKYTINVNGITLAAGVSQGFTWDGSAWGVSDVSFMYGLETQYPYKYKSADKLATKDKISIGSYEANIPYWEDLNPILDNTSLYPSPIVVPYDTSFGQYCSEYTGLTYCPQNYGNIAFKEPFSINKKVKTSIPYKFKYILNRDTGIYGVEWKGIGYYEDNPDKCGGDPFCVSITGCDPRGGQGDRIMYYTDDGLVSLSFNDLLHTDPAIKEFNTDWFDIPDSIEEEVGAVLNVQTQLEGFCYKCFPVGEGYIWVPTPLIYVLLNGLGRVIKVDVNYE